MNNISEIFSALSTRTLTVRNSKGQPFVHLRLLHVAAAATAGLFLAPRLTALASMGALVKGYSLKLDPPVEAD